MRRFNIAISIMAFCLASAAVAQTGDPKHDEMMKKMMEAGTPGAEHKVLESAVGEWNFTGKNWHGPKSKSTEWKGTSTMEMVLGGRFLKQTLKGDMMGMPYEGTGMQGYNNVEKRYEATWMDNMSTAPMMMYGQYDQKSKTLKDEGEHSCPFTETKKCKARSEWKFAGKDKMVFNLYGADLQTGKEYKMMEMTYTRK